MLVQFGVATAVVGTIAADAPLNITLQDPTEAKYSRWHPQLPRDDLDFRLDDTTEIFKRQDACTVAFGTGWVSNTCTPGRCAAGVNPSQVLPQCAQYLGLGWCCTEDGGCYADVVSACGQPGAVSCTQLAVGVSRACCPQDTTCAPGYNATDEWARCNIRQIALAALAMSNIVVSGASAPVTSTLTSSSTSTITQSSAGLPSESTQSTMPTDNAAAEQGTSASQASSSLGSGAIAGIAVGAAAGAFLVAGIIWFFWRRRQKSATQQKVPWPPAQIQHSHYYGQTDTISHMAEHFAEMPPQTKYKASSRSELAAERTYPSELPAE